jgi:hypothetical protein
MLFGGGTGCSAAEPVQYFEPEKMAVVFMRLVSFR